jgi:hypothetical protein
LSENTRRGLRAKVRAGICPGVPPLGYLNDVRTKTIVVDKRYAPLVIKLFEIYAIGNKTIREMAEFLQKNGVITSGSKRFTDDQVKRVLTNPFYYGVFRYCGELYENGAHAPLISKTLWDKVQAVIARRGHKQPEAKLAIPFCGVLKCACGLSITAERKERMQKNGNHHIWVYYRCTHKRRNCQNAPVSAEIVEKQLSDLLLEFSLTTEVISWFRKQMDTDLAIESDKNKSVSENLRRQISDLGGRQKLLLDSYLDQDIDRPTFLDKKAEIVSEKQTLSEKLSRLECDQDCWLEPMGKWLDKIASICKIVRTADLAAQKALLIEIFGSNLFLKDKNVVAFGDGKLKSSPKNLWFSLRETNKKIALSGDKSNFLSELAPLYKNARTYFSTNWE